MTLVRWQPKSPENRPWGFFDNADWDRLFGWALGEPGAQTRTRHMVPAVDVREDEGRLLVMADLPGISKDDIEITYEDGVLTITGTTTEEKEKKEGSRFYVRERFQGSFSRTLRIPDKVDMDKSEAQVKDGVLELVLPYKPEASPRKIQISGR